MRHKGSRERRAKELRARGLTYRQIGDRLGITYQAAEYLVRRRPARVRCRECDADIDPSGAMPRDDRKVYCLTCLAKHPNATFGEHLQANRLAAGLKIVELATKSGVPAPQVSVYGQGRRKDPRWSIVSRLFQALDMSRVMTPRLLSQPATPPPPGNSGSSRKGL